jgi:hypothetical protein
LPHHLTEAEQHVADLTPELRSRVEAIAFRHGVSLDAATTLLYAVAAGGGTMAQFSHPELGGMGQWSPGMTMVGDMFNSGLRAKVEALCADLAGLVREGALSTQAASFQSQSQGTPSMGFGLGGWWPSELGSPASSGAQNDMRYAYFPDSRRLAIQMGGRVRLYDTGDLQIGGVSQQQGGGYSLTFSTSHGPIGLEQLRPLDQPAAPQAVAPSAPPAWTSPPATAGSAPQAGSSGDPLALLERLAELHAKGILSAEEFAAKKAELLSRL